MAAIYYCSQKETLMKIIMDEFCHPKYIPPPAVHDST